MNIELTIVDTPVIEEPIQYRFVVDTDLIHVGGGSALVDY